MNTQEFFLGHWSIDKQMKLEADIKAAQENKETPNTTKVDGAALPYVEMAMDDGKISDNDFYKILIRKVPRVLARKYRGSLLGHLLCFIFIFN